MNRQVSDCAGPLPLSSGRECDERLKPGAVREVAAPVPAGCGLWRRCICHRRAKFVRKLLACGFLSVLAMLSAAWNCRGAAEDSFRSGVTACQAGQYAKAAQEFRKSLAERPASGTLLNLGIAEWRHGRVGEAVLSWEQTLWIDPSSRAARNNLDYVRRIMDLDPPDLTWYETASAWLPANAWAWLAGSSLWLAAAMVLLPGILRWRKAGWHQALAAMSLGVFLLTVPPYVGITTRSRIGFILQKNAPLRLTPTEDAETVSSLASGEAARELRRHGDYLFVLTRHGKGWVEGKQFGAVCPQPKANATGD